MACVRNKSLVWAECIGEDLSANNREYMVLEGSEGRKIISNKNEQSNLKMENGLPWKLQPTCDGQLCKNVTCTQN